MCFFPIKDPLRARPLQSLQNSSNQLKNINGNDKCDKILRKYIKIHHTFSFLSTQSTMAVHFEINNTQEHKISLNADHVVCFKLKI